MGGGGVDGEIHRRGGPAIPAACSELRRTRYPDGLPVGEAVLTTAGNLPARFVVHTVGPIWGADEPAAKLLASCYRKAIELVDAEGLQSISFPAISTGAYGYPEGPGGGSGVEGDRRSAGQGALGPARAAGVFQRRRPRHVLQAPAVPYAAVGLKPDLARLAQFIASSFRDSNNVTNPS